ncbi:hypothetical protein [Deinococcus cellulosilyticus]|uniref:Uncharacterized protein n=1 Tax=Deinococcus cellulosilyticus (strain DSM 18568 / NBRC 106333 / KACC 11606 / 5516J-15) TaxID=1223518 RepID=A0A511N1T5_DEIC1|nr:hypothetical protein [Deinococcus cellulosilyticus]GEM46815.1 hypothetical protein DC3_24500 [Deinococcus cellulosilyticus NBRC 106333 = KACC 11606]
MNNKIYYVDRAGNLKAYGKGTHATLQKSVQAILVYQQKLYVVDEQGLHQGRQTWKMHPEAHLDALYRIQDALLVAYSYNDCQKMVSLNANQLNKVFWTKDTCSGNSSYDQVQYAPDHVSVVNSGATTTRKDLDIHTGANLCDVPERSQTCSVQGDTTDPYYYPTNCLLDQSPSRALQTRAESTFQLLVPASESIEHILYCETTAVALTLQFTIRPAPQKPLEIWRVYFMSGENVTAQQEGLTFQSG